jgi:uncharacterized membrane protein YkvA (DUF1232 family)
MQGRVKAFVHRFKEELAVYRLVLSDRRTPWLGKLLLGGAVAYVLSPIDLIPDFIPVLGHLDDVVIVPLLVYVGLKCIPREVIEECRAKVRAAAMVGGEGEKESRPWA